MTKTKKPKIYIKSEAGTKEQAKELLLDIEALCEKYDVRCEFAFGDKGDAYVVFDK